VEEDRQYIEGSNSLCNNDVLAVLSGVAHFMPKSIQVRHVPDRLHRKLKARAAKMGISLSEYMLLEFEKLAEIPTPTEIRRRLRRLRQTTAPDVAS
jgi:hypothetical protein